MWIAVLMGVEHDDPGFYSLEQKLSVTSYQTAMLPFLFSEV